MNYTIIMYQIFFCKLNNIHKSSSLLLLLIVLEKVTIALTLCASMLTFIVAVVSRNFNQTKQNERTSTPVTPARFITE